MRKHPSATQEKPNKGTKGKQPRTGVAFIVAVVLFLIAVAVLGIRYASAQTTNVTLLSARTTTGGCTAVNLRGADAVRVFHANGATSAGAGAAVVEIRGGMTASNVSVVLGTITLTLSTDATAAAGNGGFSSQANWPFVCANVNSISGTGAAVTSLVGAN